MLTWDCGSVQIELQARAKSVLAELHERWGSVPHDITFVESAQRSFPDSPAVFAPWMSYCVLVDTHDRVLLIRHDQRNYTWVPPGGEAESTEAPAATARRTATEQTGIHCEVTGLLFTDWLTFDYDDELTAPLLQAVFGAKLRSGLLRTDEAFETESIQWFSANNLPAGTKFGERIRAFVAD